MKERGYNSEREEQNYLFPELKRELENKDSNGQHSFFPGIPPERKNNENIKNYDNSKNLFDKDPELF
jgi:hypothetical protein|tara:strand:- start:412 stop:612 length:201 start_codon:yes stop_codon:yes gene_type:complete